MSYPRVRSAFEVLGSLLRHSDVVLLARSRVLSCSLVQWVLSKSVEIESMRFLIDGYPWCDDRISLSANLKIELFYFN